jgi:hypothetical protein
MFATEKACALGKAVEFVREDAVQTLDEHEREVALLACQSLLGAAEATGGGALLLVQ